MKQHALRLFLLAGLLAVVFERQIMAVHDAWCRDWFYTGGPVRVWPTNVILVQLFPGALVIQPDMYDLSLATSSVVLRVVVISALAWAVAILVGWHALNRFWRGPRPRRLAWRPWLTWGMLATIVVFGGWCVLLRASDVRAFDHCRRSLQQVGAGATRSEVRSAIREARTAFGEVEDENVLDPAASRVDVSCSETYGDRWVKTHFHVAGDVVARVDHKCLIERSCDTTIWTDCSPGGPSVGETGASTSTALGVVEKMASPTETPIPSIGIDATESAPPPTSADPRWASVPLIPTAHLQSHVPFLDTVFAAFVMPQGGWWDQDLEHALNTLGPAQLARARNEEFAKDGYVFSDPAWQAYFAAKPWYKPDPTFRPEDLPADEKRLVEAIRTREAAPPVKLAGGNVFAADVDMDGREDLIQFEVTVPYDAFRLHVNDTFIDGTGDNLTGYAAAVDLDPSDRQREVMVGSEGPSGDPSFQLFVYDGRQLVAGDRVIGHISRIAGDGTFTVLQRARLLQTWWRESPYRLGGGVAISAVPAREYATVGATSETPVTALRDVPLVAGPERPEVVATLRKGEIVDLIGTDNERWVKARTEQGAEGWFEVVDYNHVVLDGTPVPGDLVFDGLCVAD